MGRLWQFTSRTITVYIHTLFKLKGSEDRNSCQFVVIDNADFGRDFLKVKRKSLKITLKVSATYGSKIFSRPLANGPREGYFGDVVIHNFCNFCVNNGVFTVTYKHLNKQ